MGWGTGNLGSGSGGGINFKVVGNPQPASAKENTIWVNTDNKITSWVFSAEEPQEASEGLVWIKTGSSSAAAFNAMKKNGIYVYPITANQYISGAWVPVTAKSFIGGAWVDWWDGSTLYDSGDEIDQITGGWSEQAFKASSDVGNLKEPTVTKSAENIKVELTGYSGGSYYCGCIMTGKAVDLTEFTSIKIHITAITSRVYLRIASAHSNGYTSEAQVQISATGESAVDISGISGEKYIAIAISQTNSSVTFDKIWLE